MTDTTDSDPVFTCLSLHIYFDDFESSDDVDESALVASALQVSRNLRRFATENYTAHHDVIDNIKLTLSSDFDDPIVYDLDLSKQGVEHTYPIGGTLDEEGVLRGAVVEGNQFGDVFPDGSVQYRIDFFGDVDRILAEHAREGTDVKEIPEEDPELEALLGDDPVDTAVTLVTEAIRALPTATEEDIADYLEMLRSASDEIENARIRRIVNHISNFFLPTNTISSTQFPANQYSRPEGM